MKPPVTTSEQRIAGSASGVQDHFENEIDEVRKSISADDAHLEVARARLKAVRDAAESFDGIRRSYNAGSIAQETVNRPVNDGDGGAVLDRRKHPDLGPDSEAEEGPTEIVHSIKDHILDQLEEAEDLTVTSATVTKRAILFEFEPGENASDDDPNPTVDLVIALERKDEPGLWIPNTEDETWDASDPEEHTKLFREDPKELRVFRARLVRLAKEAIKSDESPVLISFNVVALALELVDEVGSLGDGLRQFFEGMASSILGGDTDDPAGVSDPIKLPEGVSRVTAHQRLKFFADRLAEAQVNCSNKSKVQAALAEVFPSQFPDIEAGSTSSVAAALAAGKVGDEAVKKAFGSTQGVKPVRSAGDAWE